MLKKRNMLAIVLILVLGFVTLIFAAGQTVDQKSILAGKVLADGLVTPNTKVQEGEILVNINTVAGPAAAVRATVDGLVKEVLVKPGDMIKKNEVTVRIEPFAK